MGAIKKLGDNGRVAERDALVNNLRRGVFLLGKNPN